MDKYYTLQEISEFLLLTYMVVLHPIFTVSQKNIVFEQYKLLEKYHQMTFIRQKKILEEYNQLQAQKFKKLEDPAANLDQLASPNSSSSQLNTPAHLHNLISTSAQNSPNLQNFSLQIQNTNSQTTNSYENSMNISLRGTFLFST